MEPSSSVASASTAVRSTSETPKIFKAAAWVAVVAGTLLIIAGIFFAGFGMAVYSNHASHGSQRHHEYPAMVMEIPNGGHWAPHHAPSSVAPSASPGS
ncbi:hypothetical protein B1T44_01620 [Mycobacterium persicum]|nr:hypothetical protein B1T44_01620 [Mycobacterium persicum]